jgi:signal transduction histidine kinase
MDNEVDLMAKLTFDFPDQIDLPEFISVEAHDLRSAFNHIVGFSKIVLNGQDGALTDLQKEDLTTVYRSGLRALTLMNNLIDMARLSRGEKSVSPAALEIPRLLEQSINQWKKYYPGRTIQVETKILAALPTLQADEIQLKQVIAGLMAYVAEYVEDPARIVIQVDDELGWQVVTISSEGKKTALQSALDLTMLGYVNRAFIELNKGQIRVGEDRADGATISFALPA